MHRRFIITTTETVPGYEITKVLGIVHATADAVQEVGKEVLAALESLSGTKEKRTERYKSLREHALAKLQKDAENRDANAIIGLRMSSFGASSIVVYGTAVVVEAK